MNLIVIGDSSQGHEIAKRALEMEVTHKKQLSIGIIESASSDAQTDSTDFKKQLLDYVPPMPLDFGIETIKVNTKPDWIKDGNVNIGKRKAKKRR